MMQAEYEEAERVRQETEERLKLEEAAREARIREEEAKQLTDKANLLSDIPNREILLDKIRKMREQGKPQEAVYPPLSPDQQARLDKEQADGRAAVAKAEAMAAENRERAAKVEAEERARQAQMTPVVHPNPSQNEVFPATGATLGKRR